MKKTNLARRRLLGMGAVGAATILCDVLRATPEVRETEDNIEGPYYKAGAPERSVLYEKDQPGTRLTLSGRVLNTRGAAVAGAVVDVWQTDAEGRYDNEGFRMRGKLRADAKGNYRIDTVVPRYYTDGKITRPKHIHFKVSGEGCRLLTTQLYFKGDPYNNQDRYVRKSLMIAPEGCGNKTARFDFVLRVA